MKLCSYFYCILNETFFKWDIFSINWNLFKLNQNKLLLNSVLHAQWSLTNSLYKKSYGDQQQISCVNRSLFFLYQINERLLNKVSLT